MDRILAGLRAAGENTRLRLLFVMSQGEFNVTELTQILGQSQPRVSRHLKLMSDAGLLDRYKEGSWVMFRLGQSGGAGELAQQISSLLPANDPILKGDLGRLTEVLDARKAAAAAYFSANAANWDTIRSLHISEKRVEDAITAMLGEADLGVLLDLGTGTGRMLELLGARSTQATGIDASRDMLRYARSNLEASGLKNVQVRHGDLYSLPFGNNTVDLITIHQVLHYLDDVPRALNEAARVLKPEGRILIADFAPHELEFLREEHAHRRLGIAEADMAKWLKAARLELLRHRLLPPLGGARAEGLTVSIWLAGVAA